MRLQRLVVVVLSLVDSAATGDRLQALEALRDHLARAIDETDDVRALGTLAGQYRQVLAEVADLSKGKGSGSDLDELLKRRKERAKPIRGGKAREA